MFVQQHTVFKVRDTKPMKLYTKEMRHKEWKNFIKTQININNNT